ncbi:MAG: MFS transporter [Promethearchaeota archaeon]
MSKKSTGIFQKLSYGIGSIADTGSYSIVSTFLLFFLIDVVYLNAWLASLVYMIAYGIWNAINDPIVGVLSDRTHTRWGRRKPWIMIGAPLSLLFYILMWGPPTKISNTEIFIFMLLVVIGYEFAYSMAAVTWFAVFPEIWITVEERSEIVIYRQVFAVFGGALAVGLFPVIQVHLSEILEEKIGWTLAGAILGTIFTICFLISLLGIKERKEYSLDQQMPLLISIKTTFKNKTLLTYMIIDLMTWSMFGWMSAMSPFFVTHSLGLGLDVVALIMLPNMITTILFFAPWRKIYIRFGCKKTLALSCILQAGVYLMVFTIKDIIGLVLWGFFMGMCTAGILVAREVMMGDVVDEDELKTGIRREGSYFGFMIMVEKMSLVVIGLFTAILLSVFIGYDPQLPDPPYMDIALRIGMVIMIGIFTIILLMFLNFYPLSKEKVAEMQEQLEIIHEKKKEQLMKNTNTNL